MVAVLSTYVDIGGVNGTPASNNDIDALGPPAMQFRSDDAVTVNATNGVRKPASGTNYSFVKSSYLYCDTAPSLQIDNVNLYSDGANGLGTGVDVVVGDEMPTKNSGSDAGYIVATGTIGTTGNEMTTFYTGITGVTSIFSYTSGSPKSITISEAGSIIDGIGETTDYVVFQATVADTASIGQTANETGTWEFDEI
jgi:hypothetical protein